MNKYPVYRDSGVEWLGEIPEHWETLKYKIITSVFNGDSLNDSQKKKYESEELNDLPYISSKDVDVHFSTITYNNGLKIPKENIKLKIVPKYSAILCIEGGSAGRKIAFTEEEVCIVNKLACFNAKTKESSKYIYYTLKSDLFQTQFRIAMSGIIGGVAISSIKNFTITYPPIKEQISISNFLDCKMSLINNTVRLKEKQIELLKERRQILIHRAVTRGLNAEIKLKDSGVEWIGEIPVHWEAVSNFAQFKERNEPGNESLTILSVSIHTGVSSEELSEEKNIRGKNRIDDKSNYKHVKINDIVYNMMRAWQGGIGAVHVNGMVSPAYVVAEPTGNIDADFFEYQYRTSGFIQQMDRHSKGITDFRKRLYWNEFKQLKTIFPPLSEQKDIVSYIENITIKIATAISLKEQEIEKLKEYRSVLINEAVTGKIKIV